MPTSLHKVASRARRDRAGKLAEVATAPSVDVDDGAKKPAAAAQEEKKKDKPTAGATVAQPVNGCPMPDFPEADIRASRVLETFLSPEQLRDYRTTGGFVVRGADTGRRYLVCNRERPGLMRRQGTSMGLGSGSFRQLFDLDQNRALCVHDWTVPPPEEMLALMLCLTLPGREEKMLRLPEMDADLAMAAVDPAHWPAGYRRPGRFS